MIKRLFDFLFSLFGIMLLSPILFICWLLACVVTQSNGVFIQTRIGQFGKPFAIFKLRTMHVTTHKVSKTGAILRRYKLDELPQLFNVLKGDMSIVGLRPDVAGYYDTLRGDSRKILELKPGLTSSAAIKYANEEKLLSIQENPLEYNDSIIFPDKVKMNLDYYYNRTFLGDIQIVLKTVVVMFK